MMKHIFLSIFVLVFSAGLIAAHQVVINVTVADSIQEKFQSDGRLFIFISENPYRGLGTAESRFVDGCSTGDPIILMQRFIQLENVQGSSDTYLNSGQQIGAHTAIYSPKAINGLPAPLFDPITGEIDPEVAENWKKYDLKMHLDQNWSEIGPSLQGKIWIWMGDMDHFLLNPATRALDEYLKNTSDPKSDAEIIFEPMQGHCSKFSHKDVLEMIADKLKN